MSELFKEDMDTFNEVFTVKDDSTAQWCMKKIKEAEADRAMWKAHYEAQMEKVNKAADDDVAYFTAKLEEYFANVPHKATKTQESYTLPGGKLIRKKQQPKFETDDEALVPWLEENFMGQLVKVKKSADWAALKKVCSVTPDGEHVATDEGEIIPGVTVTQRPDVFKVEMEDEV
jgi:hypothetical protein